MTVYECWDTANLETGHSPNFNGTSIPRPHSHIISLVIPKLVQRLLFLFEACYILSYLRRTSLQKRLQISTMHSLGFHNKFQRLLLTSTHKPHSSDVSKLTWGSRTTLASTSLQLRQPDRIAGRVSNWIKKSTVPFRTLNSITVFPSRRAKRLNYSSPWIEIAFYQRWRDHE